MVFFTINKLGVICAFPNHDYPLSISKCPIYGLLEIFQLFFTFLFSCDKIDFAYGLST